MLNFKLTILLFCSIFLLGCVTAEEKAKIVQDTFEKCNGVATFTVTIGNFGDSISSSCQEDKRK